MNTNHISELWKASLLIVPIFAILFGVSTNSLFLGYTKYDECPYDPLLSQGLLSFGLLGSICSVAALILVVVSFFQVDDSGTHLYYLLYAMVTMSVYGISAILLAYIISYTLFTKHYEVQSENPNDLATFCDVSIHNFCHHFSATVIGLVLMFVIWLIGYFSNKMCKYLGKKRPRKKIQ